MTNSKAPLNPFKHSIHTGEKQIGLWSTLSTPITAEILAGAGYDWLLFDSEHSPVDVPRLVDILRAAAAARHAAVRVPWNDPVMLKRVLDTGAQTILVPFVQTPEEAAAAVAATRFPTEGGRGVSAATRAGGYGRRSQYLQTANEQICLIVQVETILALSRLEDIAAVPGVDGVFIGPSDLAASSGQLGNPTHPVMHQMLQDAVSRLQAVGKPAGILAGSAEQAKTFLSWGYTFVAAGVDTSLFVRAVDELRASMNESV